MIKDRIVFFDSDGSKHNRARCLQLDLEEDDFSLYLQILTLFLTGYPTINKPEFSLEIPPFFTPG
jgi:hypothetical protein